MERYPVAYVRRSSADANNPGDVSREAQEQAVRELAHRDGHNGNLKVFTDWDRSADESKESRRTGFVTMLAAIEAGETSAVYSYALDRLYRSLRTFVRLTDAAKANNVRIVTLREGVLGGDGSPMAQAFAEITAVFSSLELRTAKARAAGALEVRRSRGDHIGRAGYGYLLSRNEAGAIITIPDPDHPLEPIMEAVRETGGNILAACKLLNARRVSAPEGGGHWHPTPLRRMVERNAPELLPAMGPTGRRTPSGASASAFAQLLVCGGRDPSQADGRRRHVLTPEPKRKGYRCTVGNRTGRETHGLMWASERAIRPALIAEAARLAIPGDVAKMAESVDSRREAVRTRLARYAEMYAEGAIDRSRYDTEKTRAARDLDALSAQSTAVAIPAAVDWSWPPEKLGPVLRAMWSAVHLNEQMRVASVDWRVPEWRA